MTPQPVATVVDSPIRRAAVAVPAAARTTYHLTAAVLATVTFLVGLVVVSMWSDSLATRHIYALAGSRHPHKAVGLALQREALRHDDLLPLYGTSEVDRISAYHARNLFADAPTGFLPFTIGRPGGLVFSAVQSLGALGSSVRGRKVVVSLSPTMFALPNDARMAERYAGNLYPLQALTLLLNRDLSSGLRRQFAERLLARPAMLEGNNVLATLARLMADRRPLSRPAYYTFLPLAHLQRRLLDVQDRIWELGRILTTTLPSPTRHPRSLDWGALIEDATNTYKRTAATNPFGLEEGSEWAQAQENSSNDEEWVDKLTHADAWIDLKLLLQALNELDARALILSMPFHGPFLDSTGVSAAARGRYYAGVRELAAVYGMRVVVLDDHEADPYFFRDLGSHPSPKGWVIYDRILDAFYHDALQ